MRITIKAARVNRGLTQEKAAEMLGYSRMALQRWENGDAMPKFKAKQLIYSLYGVDEKDIEWCPQKNLYCTK